MKKIKDCLLLILIWLLPGFMILIFGPAEIYFANATEFEFVYGEFGWRMISAGLGLPIILGILTGFLPKTVQRIVSGLVVGISLAGYAQVMFLNKGLDLLGLNPDGYEPAEGSATTNLIIWIAIIVVITVLAIVIKNNKAMPGIAGVMLAIQVVALVSLYAGAGEEAYQYPETEYHLSGSGQFEVAKDENVILFILDSFSNLDLENALAANPTILEPFHDFTYYNNEEAVYCGTYPSLMHMMTAVDPMLDVTVNEWTEAAWKGERSEYFYSSLKEAGVDVGLYTPDTNIICGTNDTADLLTGKFDNFGDDTLDRVVDNKTLCKTMAKMSAYRMSPEIMKNMFYVQLDEYKDVVRVVDNPIVHENYDFHDALLAEGLSVNHDVSKRLIVQHLMGTHLYENNEFGEYLENATPEQTSIGCLYVVTEYLDRLKELGAYDDATIIITADHGAGWGQQPIFFVKQPGRTAEEIEYNDAPISHDEMLATLADACGIDAAPIGKTIYDFSEGEQRTRTLYIRNFMEDYPEVQCYTGEKMGSTNVYQGFTYTGNEENLKELFWDGYDILVVMKDSYF